MAARFIVHEVVENLHADSDSGDKDFDDAFEEDNSYIEISDNDDVQNSEHYIGLCTCSHCSST